MSLFDAIFDAQSAPVQMETFGEQATAAFQVSGSVDVTLTISILDRTEEWRSPQLGDIAVREELLRILVCTDPASGYGGLASIPLHGKFLIGGVTYAVDSAEGKGIRESTPSFKEVNLIRSRPVGRGKVSTQ